jgi:site-specific DNA recombinase
MQGRWNNSAPYYRCRYPAEYALVVDIEHPKIVYVRQDEIMPTLDRRLTELFDSANLEETCVLLASANDEPQAAASRAEKAAAARLEQCDKRLDQYRKALDSGADPTVVTKWIADAQAERAAAERVLAAQESIRPLTPAGIRQMVAAVEDKAQMLAEADPATKATLYANRGITRTYEHDRGMVSVEVQPSPVLTNVSEGGLAAWTAS